MAEEKKIALQTFEGAIDTVTADEHLQPNRVRRLFNCHILSQGSGEVGIITNMKGSSIVSYTLPAGENKCIGSVNDEEVNKFYFFVWNANSFHSILQFDALTRSVVKVLENLTDTGNLDIMRLDKDYLILHADVVRNNLLYWVDGLNNARKTNINKLFDKSATGYGTTILQSFIDAYKQTTPLPPTAVYFSDPDKKFNTLYGALRKFAVRLLYDDGEKSNVSDFSAVALPVFEPFTGVNTIPTDNNGINITFTTGDRTVKQIELFMQSTSSQSNDNSLLDWVKIATLDKKKLGVADDSNYTYKYYNDTAPLPADQEKIFRPYSFLPKRPLCQSFVKNALVYTNAYEGFPTVDVDASTVVTYEDLTLDPGVENEFNEPDITITSNDSDYLELGDVTYYNGTIVHLVVPKERRFNRQTVTIGADVKKGNIFKIFLSNGFEGDNFTMSYEAKNTDSALTVVNELKNQLIATGRIYRKTPDMPDTNIYDNTDSSGNISFSFLLRASDGKNYINGTTNDGNPVQFDTLKDTGQSLRNIKLGSSIKLGIMYEDFDGRKSLVYTVDALIVNIKTINELILDDGKTMYQSPIITLQINHKPPIWAKYYQIVRTSDLVYGKYIQLLIQKVIDFESEDEQDYLDLAVGSLFTYQKIHPNTPLTYEFSKGDRLRLLKNTETDTYYPVFETEIIAYNPTVVENMTSNLVTNGTATITVAETKPDDIGKFILVEGVEREIVAVPSGTTYLLNNVIGDTTPKTYLNYDLIDRRGSIRIRRPNDITIEDNSMVELYKPSSLSNPLNSAQFYEFQKKFIIINYGTENAYHSGNVQNQTDVLPALIRISEGTAYVRNREQPVNNSVPGTQIVIEVVEDESYSDFYPSLINDNGRINVEDNGDGEVHFGSRMRYSNNFIEDTRINGLNDFDNTDREDYYDQYGDFKRTVFDTSRIFGFKELRTTFVPVDSIITQDNNGLAMNINSAKLLNPIQYFAWEGGIGNNPESYASNGTHKYFVSANSGVIIRLGFNGEEPISKTYFFDNEVKELLEEATKNKAKMPGGFDRKNGVYVLTIEGYKKYIYFDGFNGWILQDDILPNETLFEIVADPTHGTATLTSGFEITYTPTTDYVGHDEFTYRAFIDGVWSLPKKACIEIVEPPVQLAWRQKLSSNYCVLDEYGLQNGYYGWTTLEQYNQVTGEATGVEKPNTEGQADYVGAIYDPTSCVPVPPDPTPDAYSFTPIVDAELDTVYESNVVTPTGYNIPIAIWADGKEYRLNGGAWVTGSGTMNPGDTLQVRDTSSPDYETEVIATTDAGGVSADFSITTIEEPIGDFHSLVTGGAPTRGVIGNNGGTFPNSAPYQWNGSLANNVIVLNTLPGTNLNGWLSNTNHVLTVEIAGNYRIQVAGSGILTFFNDGGNILWGFADFFLQIGATQYPLSNFNPPQAGFTFYYQYYAPYETPSGDHVEGNSPYSFAFDQTFALTAGTILRLYVSPRYASIAGTPGTFRLTNTSLDLQIELID